MRRFYFAIIFCCSHCCFAECNTWPTVQADDTESVHDYPNANVLIDVDTVINDKKDTVIIRKRYIPDITAEDVSGYFGIDIDQDYFVDWMHNTNYDRNYTQGTALAYTKLNLDKSFIFFPIGILERLFHGTDEPEHVQRLPATVALGVTAFTPREIADSLNPVIGDRPFSNVVFLTTARNTYHAKRKIFSTTSFSYGIIGSNIGNVFQSYAHKSIVPGRPTNIGWQYQISRGGHIAFLFSQVANRSIVKIDLRSNDTDSKRTVFQTFLGYKLNVGWYSSIAATASAKVGWFGRHSNNIALMNPLSNANAAPEGSAMNIDTTKYRIDIKHRDISPKWRFDGYFFGSISPRLTPYNSLILGQPGVKSIYTLPKENFNPFTLESEWGFVVSFIKSIENIDIPMQRIDIILSVNSRSSEIVSKDPTVDNIYKRRHTWGRIGVRFPLL